MRTTQRIELAVIVAPFREKTVAEISSGLYYTKPSVYIQYLALRCEAFGGKGT